MLQTLHYGFWAEWLNSQKVTFDGPNRLMLINTGVTEIDVEVDLYSDWKEWARLDDHGKYLPAMRSVGGDPTSGGRALGATFFLLNGWRIRTWEGDHRLSVIGNLFTEEGAPPFVPVVGPYTTIIESNVSNLIDRLSGLDNLALVPNLPTQTWTEDRFVVTDSLVGARADSTDALVSARADSTDALVDVRSASTDALVTAQTDSIDAQLDQIETLLASSESLDGAQLARIEALLRNRRETDPAAGKQRIYADDDVTVLFEGDLWENVAGTVPYSGNGADRADRMV